MKGNKIEQLITHRLFLPIAFLVNLLLHLPFMNRPPHNHHIWRQCNTLAVARNFCQEEMNILHTRVDNRFNTEGITGSHFPSYEYGLAVWYKILGEHDYVHRYWSLLIFYFGGLGLFFLLKHLFSNRHIPIIGTFCYLFAPELFYYQIVALPDILALSSSIWGFYFFVYWLEHFPNRNNIKSVIHWLLAIVFTLLAGLTKLQYLAIGFPIVVYFIQSKKYKTRSILVLSGIYGIIAVLGSVYWYLRAVHLIEVSGLADFGLEFRPETNLQKAFMILKMNLISWIPELILNYASFTLFVLGIIYSFRLKSYKRKWFLPFAVYVIALAIYHLVELRQMEHHGYYFMPYYIVLLSVAAYGGATLIQKQKQWVLALLLFAQPILATIRILPSRWVNDTKGVSMVLYNSPSREEVQSLIPKGALTIVGPDPSHCILFYFTQTKGFAFNTTLDLVNTQENNENLISRWIEQGAEYLILNEAETADELLPYLEKLLYKNNDIIVWKLKEIK